MSSIWLKQIYKLVFKYNAKSKKKSLDLRDFNIILRFYYNPVVHPAAQVGAEAPFPAPVAVVVSFAIVVTDVEVPAVVLPLVLFVMSVNVTFVAFKAVPTKAIVSSCSTSNPSPNPVKLTFDSNALVPLLNLIASFSA